MAIQAAASLPSPREPFRAAAGELEAPVLHTQVWPLPPPGMARELEPEPEPEPEHVYKLDTNPPPPTRASDFSDWLSSAADVTLTRQVWPLKPREEPELPAVPDLDVSAVFDPNAPPGAFGALPGHRGVGSRTYDTWLDHSNSATFLNEMLISPGRQSSGGPSRAQTPDLGPARTAPLSSFRSAVPERQWQPQRHALNKPAASGAGSGERPWTAERFEDVSQERGARTVGNITGALQMGEALDNELKRSAMDHVSRKAVRRKAAARKRRGMQSTLPQHGVAFGSAVGGSMRWTAQRSSNSRGGIGGASSLSSLSQGSIGSRSPRGRANTPDIGMVGGTMVGGATPLPGPGAGWFVPLSPKSDDGGSSSPGRGLDSRGSSAVSVFREQELQGKIPVLVQASEPSVSGRKGRQSPRHGASVRYVKSPRQQQQGTGRDPSRSHLAGKGVGDVSRYRVLDKVIEVHAEGTAPESPVTGSAQLQNPAAHPPNPPTHLNLI